MGGPARHGLGGGTSFIVDAPARYIPRAGPPARGAARRQRAAHRPMREAPRTCAAGAARRGRRKQTKRARTLEWAEGDALSSTDCTLRKRMRALRPGRRATTARVAESATVDIRKRCGSITRVRECEDRSRPRGRLRTRDECAARWGPARMRGPSRRGGTWRQFPSSSAVRPGRRFVARSADRRAAGGAGRLVRHRGRQGSVPERAWTEARWEARNSARCHDSPPCRQSAPAETGGRRHAVRGLSRFGSGAPRGRSAARSVSGPESTERP